MTDLTRLRLYLVRHGESVANRGQRWQGWGDAALTELGLSQVQQTGRRLAPVRFAAAWSSDRARALQTIEALLSANEQAPAQVRIDARLRERFYGGFEGLTTPQVLSYYPDGLYRFDRDGSRMEWRPAGGETLNEVLSRVEECIGEAISEAVRTHTGMRKAPDQAADSTASPLNILISTHGNILRLLYARAIGEPEPDLRIPANASILVLDVERNPDQATDQRSQGPLIYKVVEPPVWED